MLLQVRELCHYQLAEELYRCPPSHDRHGLHHRQVHPSTYDNRCCSLPAVDTVMIDMSYTIDRSTQVPMTIALPVVDTVMTGMTYIIDRHLFPNTILSSKGNKGSHHCASTGDHNRSAEVNSTPLKYCRGWGNEVCICVNDEGKVSCVSIICPCKMGWKS